VRNITGGYAVRDASGQALIHIYARAIQSEAAQAKVFTIDEAPRIAVNVAKLHRGMDVLKGVEFPGMSIWHGDGSPRSGGANRIGGQSSGLNRFAALKGAGGQYVHCRAI
jgi:hypothetical protein